MRTSSLALALAGVVAAGCSASSTPTRTVTGQLTSSRGSIVAQSAEHQTFDGSVAASGRFTLQLPTGASYQLLVGSAHVNWPTAAGSSRWAKLGAGAPLELGSLYKRSDGDYDCDHHASSDDHCDRDDDMDGHDGGDHDGDHHDDSGDDDPHHACDGGAGGGGTGGGGAGGGGGGGTGGVN